MERPGGGGGGIRANPCVAQVLVREGVGALRFLWHGWSCADCDTRSSGAPLVESVKQLASAQLAVHDQGAQIQVPQEQHRTYQMLVYR